jgi:hypothetical protein
MACYHFGFVIDGFATPVASDFAVEKHLGFAIPMLVGGFRPYRSASVLPLLACGER